MSLLYIKITHYLISYFFASTQHFFKLDRRVEFVSHLDTQLLFFEKVSSMSA